MRKLILAAALFALASPAFANGGGEKSKATMDAEQIQKRGTASPVYLAAAPVSATLTQNFQVKGLLQVDAGFDIPNDKLRTRAASLAPRMRDAMREALGQYAAIYQVPGGIPDADRIKTMLQAASDKALGEKGARLVIVSIMVHDGR